MKWEYDEHHEGQEGDTLREMGVAGWEAYATDVGNYNKRITLLKRRLDEPIDYKALAQAVFEEVVLAAPGQPKVLYSPSEFLRRTALNILVGDAEPTTGPDKVRRLLTGVLTGAIKNAVGAVNGVAMQDIVLGIAKAHGKAQGDAMRGDK